MVENLVIGDGLEYTVYRVKKRSGGIRIIHAPNEALKKIQLQILHELEAAVVPSPFAHGFRAGRNIVTNAMPHVGKKIVINMDVHDFFPSCDAGRLYILLAKIDKGLAKKVIQYCIIPKTTTGELKKTIPRTMADYLKHLSRALKGDIKPSELVFPVQFGLPQGAPTSPLLSNLYLRDFDWSLGRFVLQKDAGADYTRYADDLTISSDMETIKIVIKIAERYLSKYRLVLNPKKTRIMRQHRRQDVCGIVVNEKINLNREYRHLLRAMKHQENDTIQAKGHYSFEHAVYGLEYNGELFKTKTIIDAWTTARRLSGAAV